VTNTVMKILLPNLLEISPFIKDHYWVNILENYVLLFSVFTLSSTKFAEVKFLFSIIFSVWIAVTIA